MLNTNRKRSNLTAEHIVLFRVFKYVLQPPWKCFITSLVNSKSGIYLVCLYVEVSTELNLELN